MDQMGRTVNKSGKIMRTSRAAVQYTASGDDGGVQLPPLKVELLPSVTRF